LGDDIPKVSSPSSSSKSTYEAYIACLAAGDGSLSSSPRSASTSRVGCPPPPVVMTHWCPREHRPFITSPGQPGNEQLSSLGNSAVGYLAGSAVCHSRGTRVSRPSVPVVRTDSCMEKHSLSTTRSPQPGNGQRSSSGNPSVEGSSLFDSRRTRVGLAADSRRTRVGLASERASLSL
jgi:hypothetical protein